MKTNELQFDIRNVKYAVKDPITHLYGTPKDLAHAESLSLEAVFSTQKQYGDGKIIATLSSDKGMTGSLILVQPAEDYEKDMGRKKVLDGGVADVTQLDDVEHAIYYEFSSVVSGVKSTFKAWLFNVISGRHSEALTQSKENPTINNIDIPLTVMGDTVKNAAGTADYVDEKGNGLIGTRLVSKPTDTGYATFGDTVPVLKVTA
jgi:hypothetical protein